MAATGTIQNQPAGMTPFGGSNSVYHDGSMDWGNVGKWVSPVASMENLSDMFTPAQNTYDPYANMYQPNPDAFSTTSAAQQTADQRQQFQDLANTANQRQASQLDTSQSDETRGQQQTLASALMARATGTGGPSVAETQMRSGLDQNIAAMRANAAGSNNPALAAKLAAEGINNANLQTNQQLGTLRAGEQTAAQQTLAQQLAATRGQDLSAASTNLQTNMQQKTLNDNMVQFYTSQGMTLQQAQLQASIALQQMNSDQATSANTLAADIANQNTQTAQQSKSGLISTAGSVVGAIFSDRRLKKDIKPAGKAVDSFIGALKDYRFKYKDPKHGEGDTFGVMAQDLEKSKIGKSLVMNLPEGKAIDTAKGYGAVLAAIHRIDERLGRVEHPRKAA